ncbi:hypothetical protein N7492_008267 [Penicillium capsulatum]|uniref:F-box domain-containing protein n=1 Tax=Penicillium capsulatum TaxID=69766 RepID=A0A9W9HUW5_9EURO|nr:hypothetical protein N7492_008267 [Penicillium capsulatum]KAJ6105676.1 hypothetical protein N7512_009193 [Penicillium capsulatum]
MVAHAPKCPSVLNVLPQELWEEILSYLPSHDIASVVSTSRKLRAASEAALYHRIEIDWADGAAYEPLRRRVIALFLTICRRPELAANVRHVAMTVSMIIPVEDLKDLQPPREAVEYAKNIVTRAQFSYPDAWVVAIERGDPYAYATLFISQLHHLRSLRLDSSFVWMSGFPGLMMWHSMFPGASVPAHTLSSFSKLELVEYGANYWPPYFDDQLIELQKWEYPMRPPSPDQFTAMLFLPCLRSLEIWTEKLNGFFDLLERSSWSSHNLARIERLVLSQSLVHDEQVEKLLSFTSSVTTVHLGLVYQIQDKTIIEDGNALLRGLMSTRNTLEHLSIQIEWWGEWMDIARAQNGLEERLQPFHGFLRHFPNLRSAEVPLVMLVGSDDGPPSRQSLAAMLPRNLQRLCLTQNSPLASNIEWSLPRAMELVQEFLPSVKRSTPSLEQIVMRVSYRCEDLQQEVVKTRHVCSKLGLGIEIVLMSGDRGPGLWTRSRDFDECRPRAAFMMM